MPNKSQKNALPGLEIWTVPQLKPKEKVDPLRTPINVIRNDDDYLDNDYQEYKNQEIKELNHK